MSADILLIEDDPSFRRAVAKVLRLHDYATREAAAGKIGVDAAIAEPPDLIVLDIILPGISGMQVCQSLKQHEKTAGVPILMLTGEDKDGQDIVCLDMGADDYLTKPVKMERLLAHVRALLRRFTSGSQMPPANLREAGLDFDYDGKAVLLDGKRHTHLTPKEFGVLWELACRAPKPQTRETLYRRVWGMEPPSAGALKTVEVHVRRIRLKLSWRAHQWLVTVTGRGYTLQPPA